MSAALRSLQALYPVLMSLLSVALIGLEPSNVMAHSVKRQHSLEICRHFLSFPYDKGAAQNFHFATAPYPFVPVFAILARFLHTEKIGICSVGINL